MNRTARFGSVVLAGALLAAACSGTSTVAQGTDAGAAEASPPATPSPTAPPSPTPTPTLVPTAVPSPTATPVPTATAVPATPTPTPVDTTPVVIQGDGWVTTEGDIARLAAFVEETHQLEFTSVVSVLVSRDVGLEYAPNFEPFSSEEWWLLQALDLADNQIDRDVTNQVRRDRIRGLCCRFNNGTQVVVEVEATKLETDAIIVHELTHALHTQHPALFRNTRYETDETPKPFSASIEGVPQFVAFAYLALASDQELAAVTPELPIIRPDMVPLIGSGPAQHLNFAYATGPAFVDAVIAERGIEGLSDLLIEPALTNEQILFPDKYLSGEMAEVVEDPQAPTGADVVTTGTIGSAMLMFALVDEVGEVGARDLVEPWAGDRFAIYQVGDDACMVANIKMDTPAAERAIGDALLARLSSGFPDATVTAGADFFELRTCAPQ